MGLHPCHRRAVPHHHPLAPQYGVSRGSVQLRGPVSIRSAGHEVYAQEQAKADQERRERESLTSLSGRNTRRNGPGATSSPSCARNERDIMTDYFAHSVTRRVLLGFSKSDRTTFARCASWRPPSAPRKSWPQKGRRIARTTRAAPATT